MGIRVALTHQTTYRYDREVVLQPHVIRLRPAAHCRTPVLAYSLRVEPSENFLNWQQDPYGNYQARLVFPNPARELSITVDLVAELTSINPFDFFVEESAEHFPFEYDALTRRELSPYLEAGAGVDAGPELEKFLNELRGGVAKRRRRSIDLLMDINGLLQRRTHYVVRMEPGVQTPEETLGKASGSCRDTSWLLVQVLRRLGLAARFVSGYLIQLRPDVVPLEGAAGAAEDFTDLHAWAEVYLPGAGWIGFDPTSGLAAGEGHLPLACAADPQSAAPVTGSFTFAPRDAEDRVTEEFTVHREVRRLAQIPPVAKPYTEAQWEIDALGRAVDARLDRGDVRLTMGGEPTFVATENIDAPEWSVEALGDHKRLLAGDLYRRLARRFGRGGLWHFGQGKWYPGEPLPRWAMTCYWRTDGVPIWENESLIAGDAAASRRDSADANRFIFALAARIAVRAEDAVPGYEDVWYHLWRERRLPVNVDPFDSRLENPLERARLWRIFEQGLDHVVGYALPLQRVYGQDGATWGSGPWFLRSERMYLTPGDSAMGYRLPLDSLPWLAPGDVEQAPRRDPMDQTPPLPAREHLVPAQKRHSPPSASGLPIAPAKGESAAGQVRTALCVEARGGILYVFMPPVRFLEDYLSLIAAVEATAAELACPVNIEGYPPPRDARVQNLKVTPDPGVIEVNTPPTRTWRELVDLTTALYDDAAHSKLAAEKFMVDGRHTGTGGGNHVILGGATAPDSPLLRRPDLLASLLAYWNNHPSLNFLFSGLFVGPTSQAPRVDEARHDALYELEIALQQIPAHSQTPPWLIDRLLRNLLVDVTGNTHRTALSIDKLYPPDSADLRLGLLEVRSFEMPPHARMSLVQQLLLRGLVAWFWEERYTAKLVRWGTQLHDRFMLPHFVWQDFRDVLRDLGYAGMAFEEEWFTPHMEFRFGRCGEASCGGLLIELRHAIEPWHTLGEEAVSGGTARYVDSSMERMEIKVSGMTDTRHVVTCNGRRLPLFPTEVAGQFIAGVRYRAWQPPTCLHPTIGVHVPLVFDVVDTWSGRSIGGCTYHVAHPGGRSHGGLPVNALEAEARRAARFTAAGHTPGPMTPPAEEVNAHFPMTLDLRTVPPRAAMDAARLNAREGIHSTDG